MSASSQTRARGFAFVEMADSGRGQKTIAALEDAEQGAAR
jgi:hypothetical protein